MTESSQLGLAHNFRDAIRAGSRWRFKGDLETYDYWKEIIVKAFDSLGMVLITPSAFREGPTKWLNPNDFRVQYEPVTEEVTE